MSELVYDANNWLRRRFETGASVRLCYAEVLSNPGVIVFDGYGAKKRRKDIYPGYKVHRTPAPTNIYKQFDLFKEVCKWLPVALVCVPGWEADDVIATLCRGTSEPVHIKSTDVDFLQLDNVSIDRENAPPAPPKRIRLYKSVVGDQSDSIPGFKACGKGSWAKLSEDDKDRLEAFLEGEDNSVPLCLPTATLNWLTEDVNIDLVRSFWNITALFDVPLEEIGANTTVGVRDPDQLEANLARFML